MNLIVFYRFQPMVEFHRGQTPSVKSCVKKRFIVYFGPAYLIKLAYNIIKLLEVNTMKWETPSYTDLRFGFEVTMYIYNR